MGALLLAGCSSSGGTKPPSSSSHGTSSAAAGGLSKAEFVRQLNSLCASTDKQVKAIPEPSGPTDFATIQTLVSSTLHLYTSFVASASALIGKSADKVEITRNYLDADAADFAVEAPLLNQLAAAAKAKDATRTAAMITQLGNATDHSAQIAGYLTGYGLTDCATLENG